MRILIAYDGSECARAALIDLQFAGLPSQAEVLVLSVLDAWLPAAEGAGGQGEVAAGVRAGVERQRGVAEEGATRLRALFPGWSCKADACVDSPAWAIIKRAEGKEGGVEGKPADLVVVGSIGFGGLLVGIKRLVLGSVSHRVVTELRTSVRIARGRGAVQAAERGRGPKIVVGVDGSKGSRAAIEAVASRGWPRGTRVLVASFEQGIEAGADVGVMGGQSVWGGDPVEIGATVSGVVTGTGAVAEAAATLRRRCPQVSVSTVVRHADPKYAIIDLADGWDEDGVKGADCIFVGAKGVRGIERFLLGSVSTAVARNARCTVEIVHQRRVPATPKA